MGAFNVAAGLDTLAGIAWDPNIRGVLVVLTGIVVLFGSVWVVLGTDTGFRLGTLLSLAALFGFLTILAGYWWVVSPNAWKGDDPSWVVIDINRVDHGGSIIDDVQRLPNHDDLVAEFGSAHDLVAASDSEIANRDFNSPPTEEELAGLSPEKQAALIADRLLRNESISYSELAGVDRSVVEDAGLDFAGWRLMAAADAGEAQTVAGAALVELGVLGADDPFLFHETVEIGGKPTLGADPNRWDRISRWFSNAARLRHPVHYVVVQVQAVDQQRLEDLTVPGEAPPRATVDADAPVVSVIMERDLGNRRLPPALLTIFCSLMFAALCYSLHVRDKVAMARAAAEA